MKQVAKLCSSALLVSLVAAFAASSASASETCPTKAGSKHFVVCIAGKRLGTATEAKKEWFKATATEGVRSTLTLYATGPNKTEVPCESATASEGKLWSGGSASAYLTAFQLTATKCQVIYEGKAQPKCSVTSIRLPAEEADDPFGPTTGNVLLEGIGASQLFSNVTISGAECLNPLRGSYSIYGRQGCTLSEPEVETVGKKLVCTPAESKLQMGPGYNSAATASLSVSIALAGSNVGQKFTVVED